MVRPQEPGTHSVAALDYPCSGEDVMASWIQSHYPASQMAVQIVSSASKLTAPFPQIFNKSVNPQGLLQKQVPSTGAVVPPVASVPVLTSLQSSPALGPWMSELRVSASRPDPRRIAPSFLTHGLELSDLQEALEQLNVLAHSYQNENAAIFQSSSDEDDNDY